MTIHITACVRKFLKCLYTLMIGMHCFWASCRVQIPLVRSGNMGACCLLKLRSVGFSRRNWFTSNGMVHARNFNLIYVVLLTSTPPLLSPLPVPLPPLSPPPVPLPPAAFTYEYFQSICNTNQISERELLVYKIFSFY